MGGICARIGFSWLLSHTLVGYRKRRCRKEQRMTKRANLRVEVIYFDLNLKGYFLTPDGMGAWWYDSLEEARDAYGEHVPFGGRIHLED